MKFYYTYVLLSKNDLKYYYGYTENLKLRIEYILLTFLGARKITPIAIGVNARTFTEK